MWSGFVVDTSVLIQLFMGSIDQLRQLRNMLSRTVEWAWGATCRHLLQDKKSSTDCCVPR